MANFPIDSGVGPVIQMNQQIDSSRGSVRAREAVMTEGGPAEEASGSSGFFNLLEKSIEQVNEYQQNADTAVKELVSGRTKNIHETMLAVERADVSLKLMMQVRNKVLDAYREIMKMQV